MQAMGDGIAVLGSRHGLAWDPFHRRSYLVRFGRHPGIPFDLRVGLRLGERSVLLPLTPAGTEFAFVEQQLLPTALAMTGTDPLTGLQLRFWVRIPFRPQDAVFSTAPVFYLAAVVSRPGNAFPGQPTAPGVVAGTLFVEIGGEVLSLAPSGDGLDLALQAPSAEPVAASRLTPPAESPPTLAVRERLEVLQGEPTGAGARAAFSLAPGQVGPALRLAWCACAPPVLSISAEPAPFRYARSFSSLADVVAWARDHARQVEEAGCWFDQLIADHTLGSATTHLLGQTLHSWLLNTWWVTCPGSERDWFSVWEGCRYLHSPLAGESAQGLFYLALWPDLLRLQLEEWADLVGPGESFLGEEGTGTSYMPHDLGLLAACGQPADPCAGPLQDTASYLLLAYAYWRRTGDRRIQRQYGATLRRLLNFLLASDAAGEALPGRGSAGTLAGAFPASPYGPGQLHLAIRVLGALECGADLLLSAGYRDVSPYRERSASLRRTIETRGWLGDHYAVALHPAAGSLGDSAWDAGSLGATNALSLLDLLGRDLGLDESHVAEDAQFVAQRTLGPYGCCGDEGQGAPAAGWLSTNMLRDLVAAYRGVDMLVMAERYWDWQQTVNARGIFLFCDSLAADAICFSPRGLAIWGYLEAAAGFVDDRVAGERAGNALRLTTRVPLLSLADWPGQRVPFFEA
jgi:xylan 1,4-beta-xylosidase